jgi:uncharacterized protein
VKASWIAAVGMVLFIEGAIPVLFPKQWRETMRRLTALSDGQLRFIGLFAVLSGMVILTLVDLFS